MSHLSNPSSLALVLGGGGAVGNAWLIGVIAGLGDAGLDLAETASVVIGTSAGATAAAQICSGVPLAELYEQTLAPPAGDAPRRPAGAPSSALFERMRAINASSSSAPELQRAMGAFGLEYDADLPPGAAERRRAVVAARLPSHEWPQKRIVITAVDAHTGELVALDRESGADLVDAVMASTAMPGPTVAINGRRYLDGGVRSPENADLASGYANVVVLSPLGGARPDRPGQFEGLRRFPDTELAGHVEALRAAGSRVEVVFPDADSLGAMGTNMMDLAARGPAARAGLAQGRREAGRMVFA
ncbi:patatin-like phospholipase family protein [Sinomonas notoginsengisoli]|uniref:patatin-like phospholipase family protein n=1 Tax=Sinomonas notoginsengisoli TaxID=1457311 RepID=UPI001F337728|nr:patatin-like phospholipase family protein [Sinomonas notoginsengisoli]